MQEQAAGGGVSLGCLPPGELTSELQSNSPESWGPALAPVPPVPRDPSPASPEWTLSQRGQPLCLGHRPRFLAKEVEVTL